MLVRVSDLPDLSGFRHPVAPILSGFLTSLTSLAFATLWPLS